MGVCCIAANEKMSKKGQNVDLSNGNSQDSNYADNSFERKSMYEGGENYENNYESMNNPV